MSSLSIDHQFIDAIMAVDNYCYKLMVSFERRYAKYGNKYFIQLMQKMKHFAKIKSPNELALILSKLHLRVCLFGFNYRIQQIFVNECCESVEHLKKF